DDALADEFVHPQRVGVVEGLGVQNAVRDLFGRTAVEYALEHDDPAVHERTRREHNEFAATVAVEHQHGAGRDALVAIGEKRDNDLAAQAVRLIDATDLQHALL